MTTNSDNMGGNRVAERAERWQAVPRIDDCSFDGYQSSDKGAFRSVDRVISGRAYKGQPLRTRAHEDGYRLITIRCDSAEPGHKRAHTFQAGAVVLYTFAGAPGPGQECCHSNRGPAFNWFPEGVRWDTKAGNHADQVAAGTATIPEPTFGCKNAPACGNKVRKPDRRCVECVRQVGLDAARMLRDGATLAEVSELHGNSQDWIWRLAVEHGAYEGTKADAQRRPVSVLIDDLAAAAGRLSAAERDRLAAAIGVTRPRRGWLQRVFTASDRHRT